jgi:hypothetical protein
VRDCTLRVLIATTASYPSLTPRSPYSISLEDVKDPAKRTTARKDIAKVALALCCRGARRAHVLQVFTEKHKEGKNAWFFSKLRF